MTAIGPPPGSLAAYSRTLFAPAQNFGRSIEHLFQYWLQLDSDDALEWRRFVYYAEDTLSSDPANTAEVTFDVVNYTGGVLDASWDQNDYMAANTHLSSIIAAWQPYMTNTHRWFEVRGYVMKFNPDWPGSPPTSKLNTFASTGAPDYEAALNNAGQGTSPCIPQASATVSEQVPMRPNWGRFYLPFVAGNALAPGGYLSDACITAIGTAVDTAYSQMATAELYPVVPTGSSQGVRVAAVQQVKAISMDNVADVQRKRRHSVATNRVSHPV